MLQLSTHDLELGSHGVVAQDGVPGSVAVDRPHILVEIRCSLHVGPVVSRRNLFAAPQAD